MIKQLFCVFATLFSITLVAQSGAASPYSFYGIGTLQLKGTVENRSMGGISVYMDSIHVNLKNPASYAGNNLESYKNESRPVKFAVAGTHTETTLKSNNSANAKASNSAFDYIAASFPIGKLGVGFGVLPYTAVGYKLETFNNESDRTNRFNGEGGVNRVFLGAGYQITPSLSAGVDVNYNFGRIENNALAFAYGDDGQLVEYQTSQNTQSDLQGVTFNFGLAYKQLISKNLELSATLAYAPENTLRSENLRSFSTVQFNASTGTENTLNTQQADLAASGLQTTDLIIPSRLAIGAGLGKPKSWFAGAELTFQGTSNFSNPIYNNQVTTFENASQIAVGGFYIPKFNAFSGYFKRVVYRAGVRYANTGLLVQNQQINEFGISFGVGLPIGNPALFSNANLGVEFGQRGTTTNNLIKEQFINFSLSFSLNSRWFEKRKYN